MTNRGTNRAAAVAELIRSKRRSGKAGRTWRRPKVLPTAAVAAVLELAQSGLLQWQIAERVGVSQSSVSRILAGKRATP